MFRAPRGLAPGYELGVTDYHSLTAGGDKPEYVASLASVSREEKRRFSARLKLGDMEVLEIESATHPREHGSCRSSLPSMLSRTSDRQDPGVNVPSTANWKSG